MCKSLERKGHETSRELKTTTWTTTICYGESSRLRDVPGAGTPGEERQAAIGASKALVPSWGQAGV